MARVHPSASATFFLRCRYGRHGVGLRFGVLVLLFRESSRVCRFFCERFLPQILAEPINCLGCALCTQCTVCLVSMTRFGVADKCREFIPRVEFTAHRVPGNKAKLNATLSKVLRHTPQ